MLVNAALRVMSNLSSKRKAYFRLWAAISLAVLALGIAAILIGVLSAIETHHFLKQATSTQGRVIAHEARSRYLYPVIEFRDQQGNSNQFIGRTGSRKPKPEVGNIVVVTYTPGHNGSSPNARVSGQVWASPIATASLGLVLIALSLWWLRRSRSDA